MCVNSISGASHKNAKACVGCDRLAMGVKYISPQHIATITVDPVTGARTRTEVAR